MIGGRITARFGFACLLALACSGCLGCAALLSITEGVAIGFSMLRSPITLQTPEVNTCMEPGQLASLAAVSRGLVERTSREQAIGEHFVSEVESPQCRRILLQHASFERVDDYGDVLDEGTVLIIAISGGGARAARLGAHTLAQLEERYNASSAASGAPELRPLACRVSAFSTVSGGSIYVSYVASRFAAGSADVGAGCTDPARAEEVRTVFQSARDDPRARVGQRDLGPVGAVAYLSPTSFFLLPAMTLLTDRSFLDVLAHGVNLTHERYFAETMLGELPQRPRFFFNAVALETGTPFVITQRIQHLPSEPRPEWTARVDLPHGPVYDPARPLGHSLTLEDLGSSSALFPLPYAAMASAAFPPVMEPLELRYYGLDGKREKMVSTRRSVHLTDGGVFDNSGLLTAVDFFGHLVHEARRVGASRSRVRRLVLLSVNAETTRSRGLVPKLHPVEESPWGLGVNWPVRNLGARAIDQIHFTNKRRGEEIAWERLVELRDSLESEVDVELLYFPVNLTQLSKFDPYAIEGGEETFQAVSRIPTDYAIRADHDRLLAESVARILDTDQSAGGRHGDAGWPVGPGGGRVVQLGDAFLRALAGAQAGGAPSGSAEGR